MDSEFRWLVPPESPWPVPVLDVRRLTLSVTSVSSDFEAARNAISFGSDDGLGFVNDAPPTQRPIACSLTYGLDSVLADGVLFAPSAMEHKWAVFYHQSKILFVRSWKRQLILTADVVASRGQAELTRINGVAMRSDEDPEFTQAVVDFILRTHALREDHPAPLLEDPGQDLHSAAVLAFNLFGNFVQYATHHRFRPMAPIRPLRTTSLLHIDIARVDLASAQEQVDRGVPIDLLAPDGSTTMDWAVASADPDALAWVLAHGLPVDFVNALGTTALMHAVEAGRSEMVSWFLANGANPNAADPRGFTSLHRAAHLGSSGIVRLLLDAGAAADVEAAGGRTPIRLAETRGHSEIVAMLQSR